MRPIKLIVVGAGSRGTRYAEYALQRPDLLQIVGVAEPRQFYRERLAGEHDIADEDAVADWRELAARARFADGVIIATQDAQHADPAVAFAELGYHMLLEKPMAPSEAECRRIIAAAERAGILFAVCHVMRYTRYTAALKALVDTGRVGEIASIQHLEPVGYWHQAHSFVRGNWRNTAESSPMLLAKSCHDLDWIRYIMGKPCVQVSSFGSLRHFRAAERPAGAADRCLDCAIEAECPYSAARFYLGRLRAGQHGWPLDVIASEPSEPAVLAALREGPYGRCVYACDNDVVDHQVVSMRFADDSSASFTMTAFTRARDRETRIFGTRGEIYGNGRTIELFDFLTQQTERIEVDPAADGSILSGHGGGDQGIIESFVAALAQNDPARILSGPAETLETHLMVFAAEQARLNGQVVDVLLR
jgi:predicted dehydrogenase